MRDLQDKYAAQLESALAPSGLRAQSISKTAQIVATNAGPWKFTLQVSASSIALPPPIRSAAHTASESGEALIWQLDSLNRWLAALIPAVLTASIYIYGPSASAQAKLVSARTDLKKEQASAVDPRSIRVLSAELLKNQAGIARAKSEAAAPAGERSAKFAPAAEDRSGVLRAVTALLDANKLIQIKSEKLVQNTEAALSKRTLDAWRPYAERFHAPAPQIWKFELRGGYPQMLNVCEELSRSPEFIVPLSVTMEPSDASGTKADRRR